MPLPPWNGIGSIERRRDGQSGCRDLAVYIQRDGSAAIGRIKKICTVNAGVRHFDGDVEPFSWLGPSHIELILRRLNYVVRTVVDLVVKLCVRDVDAFVHAKLIQVGSVGGI